MPSKICETCGERYEKPYGYSVAQWELRRFCGQVCFGISIRENLLDRFEKFFNKSDPYKCWEWTGGRHNKGYGQIGLPKTTKAHRVAWTLYRGPIPKSMQVLHKCDNPPCVNPNHLFIGTNLDNVKDKISKGRNRNARGSLVGGSALTETDVLEILGDTRYQHEIAADYGVAQTTISAIKRGKNWSWLTGDTHA